MFPKTFDDLPWGWTNPVSCDFNDPLFVGGRSGREATRSRSVVQVPTFCAVEPTEKSRVSLDGRNRSWCRPSSPVKGTVNDSVFNLFFTGTVSS